MTIRITPFLRNVITLDAIAGAAMATAFTLGGGLIANLSGLPQALLFWAGAALIPYVALLVWLRGHQTTSRLMMVDLVIINAVWVAVSIGLLVSGAIAPNALGIAFDLIQAAAVGAFGVIYAASLKAATTVSA